MIATYGLNNPLSGCPMLSRKDMGHPERPEKAYLEIHNRNKRDVSLHLSGTSILFLKQSRTIGLSKIMIVTHTHTIP